MTAALPAAAFAAGVASSTGPCIAPRLAALIGVTAGHRGGARAARIGAFAAGSCGGYAALGAFAGILRHAIGYSPLAYALLAAAFAAGGVGTLIRQTRRHDCAGSQRPTLPVGATFLTGLASAVAGSPCCGPVAAGLAAAAATRSPWLVLAFAAGHASPLLAAAAGWQPVSLALAARFAAPLLSSIGGGVALGLAAYYALLV